MYTHMTNRLPRVRLGLLLLLGLTSGQLLFAQRNSNQSPVAVDDVATVIQGQDIVIPVLANDYDPDGDPLTLQNVRQARGVAHTQADGTILYRPTPNFVGEDSFEYTIIDGNRGRATGTVVVTVLAAPSNEDPTAVDDDAITDEDTPVTIDVLVNDFDNDAGNERDDDDGDHNNRRRGDDGDNHNRWRRFDSNGVDTLFVTSVEQGANGSTVINTDGTITYTPVPDFNGSDSFDYTISDGDGGSATATVSVTVNPINDAPVAYDQSVATNEDESVAIVLTGSDVDGDLLTFSVITSPGNGQLSGTPPNLTYTPNANFNGQDSFPFQVSDGQASDQGTVSISVGAYNDPPLATDDAALTDEDTPVTIDVLANDSDPEGDALSIEDVTEGSSGSVSINPDGTITYSPSPDFNGTDNFSYTVSDGYGGTDEGTVSVTVIAINDAPVALDDAASTPEDTPMTINVLANDSDVDGDPLTIQNVTQANGVVHINPDGTLSYDPTPNFYGIDEFYYTVIDGNGGHATATVIVNVGSENDSPLAVDDAAETDEDTAVTIAVLTNDSDPDGDDLSVDNVTQGSNGAATLNPDGSVTYIPTADFNGSDSFAYTISDGNGGTATANVYVTINAVNDAPIADDQSVSTNEDESIAIILTSSDVDGDPLTFSVISGPANGQLSGTPPNLTYTPDADFNGQDGFTFQVSDGQASDQGVVDISVGAFNDPPAAVSDNATTDEDTPVTIGVLANDSDPEGDDLSIESVTQGVNGLVSINPDGTLTYEPAPDFNGSDSFTYTVSDGNGGSDQASVSVTVNAVNDAPVAVNDTAETQEDTPITIDVLANDSDVDGDALTIQNVTQHNGVVHVNPDGTLAYDPTPNFSGTDDFYYTVIDGNGGHATAAVTVAVISENDAPLAADQSVSTNEDESVAITLTGSDVDGDPLTFSIVTSPANGQLTGTTPNLTYTPTENYFGSDFFTYTASDGELNSETATVSITVEAINDPPVITSPSQTTATEGALFTYLASATDSDDDAGSITFSFTNLPVWLAADGATISGTPGEGDGSTAFTITADDGHTENNLATLEVTLTVQAVNDPPVAHSQHVTINEDAAIAITLTGSDPENTPLTYEVLSSPEHGTLSGEAPDLTYTPNADYYGEDSFTFRVNDGDLNSGPATVSITVEAINDPPVITSPASASATEDELFTYITTVEDVDDETVDITFDGLPDWVNVEGSTASGTPGEGAADFEFFVIADDGHDANNLATLQVQVTVGAVNDPPVAQDQAIETSEDQSISLELTASDAENDPLTFEILAAPSHGILDGTAPVLYYTPAPDYFGDDSFTFLVSDGTASDEGTVTITVAAVNDDPLASDDETNTPQDTPVTIDVLANDSDIDSEILTITGTSDAGHGTVALNPDGTLNYSPNTGFSGTDSFQYTISDGDGGSATATVTVYVNIDETAVSDTIGTGGGVIDTDFGAGIDIPAGALDTPVNIVISQFAAAPPGVETAGPVYFFGPTGTYFSVPVTITVAYDPDRIPLGLDASRMSLLRYNESDGTWEVIPATVDSIAHLVIGQTDHFSGFAAGFAPNRAPTVVQNIDDLAIPEDTPYATLIENISDYFADPDEGDHLAFSANSLDEGLDTLIISQELSLFAIPVTNFFGEIRIVVSATDDWSVTTSDTLLLTVSSVNDAPEFPAGFRDALASVMNIQEDQVLRINLIASDIEGDDVTFQATSDTSAVTVAVAQDTTPVLVVVPEPNWFGTARIGISASDGEATTSLDPVTLTVEATNDIPEAFDLLFPGNGDQLFMTSENNEDSLVFEWDAVIDPDGDPVSYTFVFSDSMGVNWEYAGLESNNVSVAYADIAAAIRALGLNSVTFWWSVVAIAGTDTVPTSQGPFQLTIDAGTLSVEDGSHIPQLFALHQNYPNPFNPVTTIRFEVPRASYVLLVIYDMRGREVIRLVDEFTPPGYNKVMWNSSDAYGRPVPSGVYIARMVAENYTRVIKMTIIR